MLFLLSFVIFNDDLKKEFSFVKGILPGIFSGIVLYIIFYIGAFIIKVMPGGLENSVEAAFNKYSTHSLIIWLLLIVAIIPGEEIFWRGFVLKRLNHYFNPWFSNVFAALLCMVMMFPSGNFCSDYWYLCRFTRMEYHVLLSSKPTYAIFIAFNLCVFVTRSLTNLLKIAQKRSFIGAFFL
ncbi:TPA: CPBP family glutamic-type intramembrane protease [Listeria monocytogenes]